MLTKSTALVAFALAGASFAFVADASAASRQPYPQCMTDDGYGRIRPCSNLYKREHPNWRAGNECMTDDGYGRFRPCDALYKQRHAK